MWRHARATPRLLLPGLNNNKNNNKYKTIDISNETLIKTFSTFQITNSQFDYFFIWIKVEFFWALKKGMN